MSRPSRTLICRGREQSIEAWSSESGIAVQAIRYRLRQGWPIERAIFEKTRIGVNQGEAYRITRRSFVAMHTRCYDPTAVGYSAYGGAGIYVIERWHDMDLFLEDMGYRPSRAHSIDRELGAMHYGPDVCRWATRVEQARNRSSNTLIEHNGESRCLAEWSAITGINESTISGRLKRGWSVARSLSEEPIDDGESGRDKLRRMLTLNGETKSIREWANQLGVTRGCLERRLIRGWPLEVALTKLPDGQGRIVASKHGGIAVYQLTPPPADLTLTERNPWLSR